MISKLLLFSLINFVLFFYNLIYSYILSCCDSYRRRKIFYTSGVQLRSSAQLNDDDPTQSQFAAPASALDLEDQITAVAVNSVRSRNDLEPAPTDSIDHPQSRIQVAKP